MAEKIAVMVIHGMGSQRRNYSRPLRQEISERLGDQRASRLMWEEIYWADLLIDSQQAYLRRANRDDKLDFIRLRRFLVSSFGDAAAYRKTTDANNTTYDDVHSRVREAVDRLDGRIEDPRTPLVVFAHSLGGHVISNYVWDLQKPHAADGLSWFQAMKTLAGLITFGSNIPFFVMAYEPEDIEPISFPGSRLRAADKERARWLNFFDPDDVLGYPLRPINAAYRKVVDSDAAINVGGLLASWNPLSHQKYWTDNDFTGPASQFLGTLLD